MFNPAELRLGKRPARFDPRAPRFESHKMASMPPPEKVDWTTRLPEDGWGLWKNDALGDCTAVGIGNALLGWTSYTREHPLAITDDQVIRFYSATTGYNQADPSTDRGGVELDVLKYVSLHGFDAGGPQPEPCSFVVMDPSNFTALRNSIAHLGVAYLGLQLPLSAQYQPIWRCTNGKDGDDTPGGWGGHCVIAKAYDTQYATIITWKKKHLVEWDWLKVYMDEAYGLYSSDWLNTGGRSPEGLDRDRLLADLVSLYG
jgi:hypothetical protein